MNEINKPMADPLQLRDQEPANEVKLARAAPHPEIERLYRRLASGECADSSEVRLMLLGHLVYIAYRDIKETVVL